MKCLEKRPADRWQTAEELLVRLEGFRTPGAWVNAVDTPRCWRFAVQPAPRLADQRRIGVVLGGQDRAVRLLRQAFSEGPRYGFPLHREPEFESLRDYARFRELVRPIE
jgi:hypothetical protein